MAFLQNKIVGLDKVYTFKKKGVTCSQIGFLYTVICAGSAGLSQVIQKKSWANKLPHRTTDGRSMDFLVRPEILHYFVTRK
jgi:hypothetical protein